MIASEKKLLGVESLTRMWPFWKGRGVLANSSFLRSERSGKRLVVLNEGMPIYVTENDYISRMIRFFGDFDPCLTRLIKTLVRPGHLVIDIGANLGVVSLPMAKWVGAEGMVYAFEPQRLVCELLNESVQLNTLANICIFPIALSSYDGHGQVEGNERSLGTARLSISRSAGNSASCEVRRLDSMNLETGGRKVEFIKIDVEGHEADVLTGACEFINYHKPTYILFESHPVRGEFENRGEVQILRSLGYALFSVRRSFFQRPYLKLIPEGPGRHYDTSDFLAKRKAS